MTMMVYWIFILLALVPLVCAMITVYFRVRQLGSPDYKNPDQQGLQLTERGARSWYAQAQRVN